MPPIPPQLIILLVQFGLQYGPVAVAKIVTVLENPNSTVADVKAAFADLKPYADYGIPGKVP